MNHLVGDVSVVVEKNKKTHTLDDFVMPTVRESELIAMKTEKKYVSLVALECENTNVTPLIAIEIENSNVTPLQQSMPNHHTLI